MRLHVPSSQSYVFVKQSDSPCPSQFQSPGANPSPEVTNPFCRIPLRVFLCRHGLLAPEPCCGSRYGPCTPAVSFHVRVLAAALSCALPAPASTSYAFRGCLPPRGPVSPAPAPPRPHAVCVAALCSVPGTLSPAPFRLLRSVSPAAICCPAEPCSSSALVRLPRVLTTPSKICTRPRSTLHRCPASAHGPRSPTRPRRPRFGRTLTALHLRGPCVRQVRCNTLPTGCLPPWPPPCCLHAPTPSPLASSSAPYRCSRFTPLRQFCLPAPAH